MGQGACSTNACSTVDECSAGAYATCDACVSGAVVERERARQDSNAPVFEYPASPMPGEWHGDIGYREQDAGRQRPEELWAEVSYGDQYRQDSTVPMAGSPMRTPKTLKESLGMGHETAREMSMRPEGFDTPAQISPYFEQCVEHSGHMPAQIEEVHAGRDQLSARSNKVMWPDGSCYEGDRQNGYAHGHGKLTRLDGSTYVGEWVTGEKNGRGQESWADGTSFEGEYLNSCRHGQGFLRVHNGMTYEGQFVNEKMHGQGMCTFADGRSFNGQWQQGHITGHGDMTWPNGSEYSGEYVKDAKHGSGTFKWPDGRSYAGQWMLGKQDGTGIATDAQGKTLHGEWSQGRLLPSSEAASKPQPTKEQQPQEQQQRIPVKSAKPKKKQHGDGPIHHAGTPASTVAHDQSSTVAHAGLHTH